MTETIRDYIIKQITNQCDICLVISDPHKPDPSNDFAERLFQYVAEPIRAGQSRVWKDVLDQRLYCILEDFFNEEGVSYHLKYIENKCRLQYIINL